MLILPLRGLRPRTPGYFLCGQKVTKKPHRGGTLSMGSLPYIPLPHDDTKGGARRHKLRWFASERPLWGRLFAPDSRREP